MGHLEDNIGLVLHGCFQQDSKNHKKTTNFPRQNYNKVLLSHHSMQSSNRSRDTVFLIKVECVDI